MNAALVLVLTPVAAFYSPHAALRDARPRAAASSPHELVIFAHATIPRATAPLAVASSPDQRDEKQLDVGSLGRYLFAVLIQLTVASTALGVVDVCTYGPLPGDIQLGGPLPWQAVVGIFLAMSVRSRVFSPLDNSRPDVDNLAGSRGASAVEFDDAALEAALAEKPVKINLKGLRVEAEMRGLLVDQTMVKKELEAVLRDYLEDAKARAQKGDKAERILPSWTPPGVVFPIMWVLVVAPLRAFSTSLVYEASTGRLNEAHLNDPVILWLVLHLCIGDTWNTINNVERRTGAAVPGVALVWLSTLFAAKQYYDVVPLAGMLLGLTAVWITVAGALVADTWRVNNEVEPEPLFPYKRPGYRSQTRLFFEE